MLTGLWITPSTYRFSESETKRSLDVIIPGVGLLNGEELNELILWQREGVGKLLADPKPPDLTRVQQHDLGATLMEIKASKRHRRETGHGRFY